MSKNKIHLKPLINVLLSVLHGMVLKSESRKCQGIKKKNLEEPSNVGANIPFPRVQMYRNHNEALSYRVLKKEILTL